MNFVVISNVWLLGILPHSGVGNCVPKKICMSDKICAHSKIYGYTNDPSSPIITLGVLLRILHAQ
jgi:hypothetical protein